MKTEEQIREMKENIIQRNWLVNETRKNYWRFRNAKFTRHVRYDTSILDDKLSLVYSEDYKNLYWFIDLQKNRFVISSIIDKNRTSDKERKEEGII